MKRLVILIFLLIPTLAFAQFSGPFGSISSGGSGDVDTAANYTWTGNHSLENGTLTLPSSNNLPGTCSVGMIYMDTDATTGQRIYACQSANVWALQGDGSSGGSSQWTTNGTSIYYNTGNIGVGEVTPDTAIHTNGIVTAEAGVKVGTGADQTFTVFTVNNSSEDFTMGVNSTDHTFVFSHPLVVNGTEQTDIGLGLHVNSDGEGSPENDFQVEGVSETHLIYVEATNDTVRMGDSNGSNYVQISSSGEVTFGGAAAIVLSTDDIFGLGAGKGLIEFEDATTDSVNIMNANVGIGTTEPARLLHLHEADVDGTPRMMFTNTTTGATSGDGFQMGLNDDESVVVRNKENTSMGFFTNDIEHFTLGETGTATFAGNSMGWAIVDGADNTACTTICTSAAVHGWNGTAPVGPADATADICLCAGGS